MKKNKKAKKEEQVIYALDQIDKAAKTLNAMADNYNGLIDEAGLRNDAKRVETLISQKIGVVRLANMFTVLKQNIIASYQTSKSLATLSGLPELINNCRGLLNQAPDFNKLAKSIKGVLEDIQGPTEQLQEFNDIVDSVLIPESESSFKNGIDDLLPKEQTEHSEEFKAEYEAMLLRIKPKVQSNKVVKADDLPDEELNTGGLVDYEGIISEENKKK